MRSTESGVPGRWRHVSVSGVLAMTVLVSAVGASAKEAKPVVGQLTYVKGSGVRLNNSRVNAGGTKDVWKTAVRQLHARDVLTVAKGGGVSAIQFVVELELNSTKSEVFCNAGLHGKINKLQVVPVQGVLVAVPSGNTLCGTAPSATQKVFEAGRDDEVRATATDPIIEITAGPNGSVVKVRRGAVVVSSSRSDRQPVVIGKNQQTLVPVGGGPTSPKASAQPSTAERKQVQQLARRAPQSNDVTKPVAGIQDVVGAHQPVSSLRTATFSFAVSEPNAIASCALDGGDFRVCTSPQSLTGLQPGPHVFRVRATDPAGNVGPAAEYSWTVDGSRILFESFRDRNDEIYSMETDGTGLKNLSNNGFADQDPAWSHDGRRIAFHSNREGGPNNYADIYVMNADGSGQERLTPNPTFDRNPAWSPDGKQIVFQSDRDGNEELYVLNVVEPEKQVRLTFDPGSDQDPAWSPDGSTIAFASNRSGSLQIYVMNPDGSGVRRLTTDERTDFNPAWSPDGKTIAFSSNRDGFAAIWKMNADGSAQTRVTNPLSFDDLNPTWAPDGQEIAYQSDHQDGNGTDIYLVDASGNGTPLRLTDSDGDNFVPNWSSG
jgi:Tol biopolymer transport system component